jgi:putative transposase
VPSPPRPTAPGLYHLACTSTTPDPFFRDAFDRITFISYLARVTELADWTCVCACLMTTHYHLIVDAGVAALPDAMQRLNWAFAREFNRRHGRRGHHVGRKFKSIWIGSEEQLLTAYRYVVRNPVRAGICEHPQDWPWSSYASTVGLAAGFGFVDASPVLDLYGGTREQIVERLRGFCEPATD